MSYQHDVFISYAHIDNLPPLDGQSGWIDDFHHALSVRVSQVLGRPLDVWRDPKLAGNDILWDTIDGQLPSSAVLVSVLSPRYVNSEACTHEFQAFCDGCNPAGIAIGDKARIFKVVKTPFPPNKPDLAPIKVLFRKLLGYEFFQTDPQSGKFHEVSPDMKQEYWKRLDDLAQDIANLLDRMAAPETARGSTKPVVYLAEASLDSKDQRDDVRRDLERRGYTVLPSRPLPLGAEELNDFVRAELARAAISIHIVGTHYGIVPDGSELSIVETQLALAEKRSQQPAFVRLVWMPPGLGTPALEVADLRNRKFISHLRTEGGWNENADLLETGLEALKTCIDDRLKSIEEANKRPAPASPNQIQSQAQAQPAQIYLICDRQDRDSLSPLRDFLFDSGFEVSLPLFDGDEAAIGAEHTEALSSCDAVVLFFGAADELFLRKKLRDLQKCAADRKQQLRAKAICLAPPITPAKRDFRTHEFTVIQQTDAFDPAAWASFVYALNAPAASLVPAPVKA